MHATGRLGRWAAACFAFVLAACSLPGRFSGAASVNVPGGYLSPGIFSIDGTYTSEDMNAAYMDGYLPATIDGRLHVVLPLLASTDVDGQVIYCDLDLGSAQDSPFSYTNYDSIPVRPLNEENPDLYVARFALPLKSGRENGVYTLGVTIRYRADGRECMQVFHISFLVWDGAEGPEEPGASEEPDEPLSGGDTPSYSDPDWGGDASGGTPSGGTTPGGEAVPSEPKVIMSACSVDPAVCPAGGTFTVTCVLHNTSKKSAVSNMVATYKSQTNDLIPEGGSSTSYIESIGKDGTAQITFRMQAAETAASGPQKIDLALAYEGPDGSSYTAADEITVLVQQRIRLEYDRPDLPAEVFVGESFNASLNLYNKGRSTLYNVTVSLDVPGVLPDGSVFAGNLESGGSKTADIYAQVTGLPESVQPDAAEFPDAGDVIGEIVWDAQMARAVDAENASYDADGAGGPGSVSGEFIITYEDEFGTAYTEPVPVELEILAPQPGPIPEDWDEPVDKEDEESFPWWGWLLIGGGAAGAGAGAAVHHKRKKRARELEEEIDGDDLY